MRYHRRKSFGDASLYPLLLLLKVITVSKIRHFKKYYQFAACEIWQFLAGFLNFYGIILYFSGSFFGLFKGKKTLSNFCFIFGLVRYGDADGINSVEILYIVGIRSEPTKLIRFD